MLQSIYQLSTKKTITATFYPRKNEVQNQASILLIIDWPWCRCWVDHRTRPKMSHLLGTEFWPFRPCTLCLSYRFVVHRSFLKKCQFVSANSFKIFTCVISETFGYFLSHPSVAARLGTNPFRHLSFFIIVTIWKFVTLPCIRTTTLHMKYWLGN